MRQTLAAGAALVTFSGDKLLGGPQAGIIAGRADLVERCRLHPLARALRPGGLVLEVLQQVALAYLNRDAGETLPVWKMATRPVEELRSRAEALVAAGRGQAQVVDCAAAMGGGTLSGRGDPVLRRGGRWRREPGLAHLVASGDRQGPRRPHSLRSAHGAARAGRPPRRRAGGMRVIATAGHVDHGKSTLVWGLTGTDPDRWAEEKSRGLTIDLGFAFTTLPSGQEVGFVDVPGHGRLVKNMLAGVSAVDACLFVVAASEGWKEQSEEHLRILELLGIGRGVVALTKVGLVDDDERDLAAMEIADRLHGTFLEGAEIVPVDVPGGMGLDVLRAALDRLVERTPPAADRGRPRLWVDRSFAIRGAGPVVTGTLVGGSLKVDDELLVEPGHRTARIRGLQSHHRRLETAPPGRRLAINLSGVSHHEVRRGQALVRPGQWHLTAVLDGSLQVLHSVAHPVTDRGAFAVYLGSGDFPARLRILGARRQIEPGQSDAVRMWLGGRGAHTAGPWRSLCAA